MTTPALVATGSPTLARMLECCVSLAWLELMVSNEVRLVHVEFPAPRAGRVDSVTVWSCRRKEGQQLICAYRANSSPSRAADLTFHNGYSSPRLARLLSAVLEHQERFGAPSALFAGLVQVSPPGNAELAEADRCLSNTFGAL